MERRPLLLDLFCGAGGAAKGYQRAGFDVVGIDIKPQPRHAGNGQRDRIEAHTGKRPGIAEARAAMGIDWMRMDELSQAIPPDYTEFIGAQLLSVVKAVA